MTRWIKTRVRSKLGFEVEFVPVPRGQEVEQLNLLMASGRAPDIGYTYSVSTIHNCLFYIHAFNGSTGTSRYSRLLLPTPGPSVVPRFTEEVPKRQDGLAEKPGRKWSQLTSMDASLGHLLCVSENDGYQVSRALPISALFLLPPCVSESLSQVDSR